MVLGHIGFNNNFPVYTILMRITQSAIKRAIQPFQGRIGGLYYMYKGVRVRFADFISFFLMSHENEIIWSHWMER